MKEIVIETEERTYIATENLKGEARIFNLPMHGRIFEADMENPNGHEDRSIPQTPESRNDDYCLPSQLIADLPKEYQLNYRRHMRRITQDGKD